MTDRTKEMLYWIETNDLANADGAEAVLAALIAGGDYGVVSVEVTGKTKIVTGLVSPLVLPDESDEADLIELLGEYTDRE